MSIRKTKLISRRRSSQRKIRSTIDALRLAVAAVDRIRVALVRAGHGDRIGDPTTPEEITLRSEIFGRAPPPSYLATLRLVSKIGEPERLLSAREMGAARDEIMQNRPGDRDRYVPFARAADRFVCFDKELTAPDGELPVVEWVLGSPRPRFRHFGDWLDVIADEREESLEHAAAIPERLSALLADLGFSFEYPSVGRLETADVLAVEELLGPDLTREVRADVDRLFDSTGKAALTLNVEEFTLTAALRTGNFVFEAGDVFRWLRYFRDENFFGDTSKGPSHPDLTRDLRTAAREAPLVLRGTSEVHVLPAEKHQFSAASGVSADDFYLLGRAAGATEQSPSLLLHVVGGRVTDANAVDEPLTSLFVAPDGVIWGLSTAGTALRFVDGRARSFPLARPTRGRTAWNGLGGDDGGRDAAKRDPAKKTRILVWGAGALLSFDGEQFAPFSPDAALDESESVIAVCPVDDKLVMLVSGDRVGAIARFDGRAWAPIPESHVIEGNFADLDVWRGTSIILGRSGHVWRADGEGPPMTVIWDNGQAAFVNEAGGPRATHCVRGFDGGALVGSDGGVIAVCGQEPVFHSAGPTREPARLARLGNGSGIVAMIGPHVWVWRSGGFQVVDLREW